MDDNLLDITTLIDTAINMRVMKELQPEKGKIGYSEKYWKLKYQITKEIANIKIAYTLRKEEENEKNNQINHCRCVKRYLCFAGFLSGICRQHKGQDLC